MYGPVSRTLLSEHHPRVSYLSLVRKSERIFWNAAGSLLCENVLGRGSPDSSFIVHGSECVSANALIARSAVTMQDAMRIGIGGENKMSLLQPAPISSVHHAQIPSPP